MFNETFVKFDAWLSNIAIVICSLALIGVSKTYLFVTSPMMCDVRPTAWRVALIVLFIITIGWAMYYLGTALGWVLDKLQEREDKRAAALRDDNIQ